MIIRTISIIMAASMNLRLLSREVWGSFKWEWGSSWVDIRQVHCAMILFVMVAVYRAYSQYEYHAYYHYYLHYVWHYMAAFEGVLSAFWVGIGQV